MRTRIMMMMMVSILLFSGCTEKENGEKTNLTTDVPIELAEDQEALKEEFLTYVKTIPGLAGVRSYVEEHIISANEDVADMMVYELIAHGDFDVYDETDSIFEEVNIGIHNYIYDIYSENSDAFSSQTAFVGEDKGILLALVEDEVYASFLEALFNQGYGLSLREGAYYPVTDYIAMRDTFNANISEMTYAYLDILGEDLLGPVTNEEYLAISFEALGERAVKAEEFLMKYPDVPKQFKGDVGQILATCLWKLAGPNIFDGMLNEDFTVSKDLEKVYEDILNETSTPTVTATVKGITEWIEEDEDGVLGTMNDMTELYQASNDVFREAMTLMDELYPMQ